MKPSRLLVRSFSALIASALLTAGIASAQPPPAAAIPDQYVVQLRPGANPQQVAAVHGASPSFIYQSAVNGFAGHVPPGRLAALAADPRVAAVVPDRVVTINAKPGGGGSGSATQVVPLGVQRIGAAPGASGYTGAGVGVAVVDTGIDFNHADLVPLGVASFSAFGGSALDNNGHGTHVAGTIAARHNAIDVVGVASAATLYAVKVLDASGSGSDSAVAAGLDWIAANAALVSPRIRVVNMSLGRAGTLNDNPVLHAAIQNLVANGITVVVAAGNDASLEVSQQVPATYPEVIAVASVTAAAGTNDYRFFSGVVGADTASYFSTDGAYNSVTGIGVTISAPGEDAENISKTGMLQSVGILSAKLGGGTTRMSGTSMASPHAAGVAALVWQKALAGGGSVTPAAVRQALRAGATGIGSTPKDSPTTGYTYDGVREGVLSAPGALAP
jgi:subtilisin